MGNRSLDPFTSTQAMVEAARSTARRPPTVIVRSTISDRFQKYVVLFYNTVAVGVAYMSVFFALCFPFPCYPGLRGFALQRESFFKRFFGTVSGCGKGVRRVAKGIRFGSLFHTFRVPVGIPCFCIDV